MKGQMFLIATLIIISSLFLARYSIKFPGISRQKLILEMSYENEYFDNLRQELENSIIFSASEKGNITHNAYNFMNFSIKKSTEKGLSLEIFFVGAYSNYSNSSLKVSSINLLDEKINVSLNLSGDAKESELDNYEQWDTFYSITPGSTYWLYVIYDNSTRNLTLKTSSTKDVYFFYFDLNLSGEDSVHTKKFDEKIILP
jgi:hypothetical protein